ncbi:MAG: hypothetical protein R3B74_04500 [Nitrospirales bacterium]|nr:hypothetical protein [Nitrospirales bacterium]
MKTVLGGNLPSEDDCAALANDFLNSVSRLGDKLPRSRFFQILEGMFQHFAQMQRILLVLDPHDDGSFLWLVEGTHFIIAPAASILSLEIATEDRLRL